MQNTGLLRRIGAMVYDGLLLFAVLMLATVPFIIMRGGEAVEPTGKLVLVYRLSLLAVIYAFFVGYWSTRGRTLGMQSWGLQVINQKGRIPSLGQATLRFISAGIFWALLGLGALLWSAGRHEVAILFWVCFGLGFFWQLWDKEGLALHDRLSGTRTVYIPKQKKETPAEG